MLIEVKNCYRCPFIIRTREGGQSYYDCARGTFYNHKEISKTEMNLECPLIKESIEVRLDEVTQRELKDKR